MLINVKMQPIFGILTFYMQSDITLKSLKVRKSFIIGGHGHPQNMVHRLDAPGNPVLQDDDNSLPST